MTVKTFDLPIPYEELATFCREHQIASQAVFGSAARGEMTPESDIDLLVTFREGAPIGLMAYARIQRELAGILGRSVDLVTPEGLKPRIKEKILDSAVPIYANN